MPNSSLAPYFFRQPWRDALWSDSFRQEGGTTSESKPSGELSDFVSATFGGPSDLSELVGPFFLPSTNAIVWGPASASLATNEVSSRTGFCGALLRERLRLKQEPIDQRLNEIGFALDDALWDLACEQFEAAYPLFQRGEYEPALETLRRGETNCPTDFFSQYYLGVLALYGKTNKIDCVDLPSAEKHFRAAADGAQHLLTKLPWAWTYAIWSRHHTSVACYAQAVEMRYPIGNPGRERALLATALDEAERAVRLEPGLVEAHYQAARCAALLQNRELAGQHIRAAATADPIWLLRAECDADFDSVRAEVQTVARQMREELRSYVQWIADSLDLWMAEETDLLGKDAWPKAEADQPASDLWRLHRELARSLDERTYLSLRRAAIDFNESLAPRLFTPSSGPEGPDPASDLSAHVYARTATVSLLKGTEQMGRLVHLGAQVARARQSATIAVEHVLLALLGEVHATGPGPVWDVEILAVDAADAAARLSGRMDAQPSSGSSSEPYAPPKTLRLLEDACAEAANRPVGPQHLLIAINRERDGDRWIISALGIRPDRISLLARPSGAPAPPPAELAWDRVYAHGENRQLLGSPSWSRPLPEVVTPPVGLWTLDLAIHVGVRFRTTLAPFEAFAEAALADAPDDLKRVTGGLKEVEESLNSPELGTTIRAYLRTCALLKWCGDRAIHSEDAKLSELAAARRAWQVAHAPAADWSSRRNVSRGLSSLATYTLFGLPVSLGLAVIVNVILGDIGVIAGGPWQELVPRTALLLFLAGGAIATALDRRNQAARLRGFEASSQTGEEIESQAATIQGKREGRAARFAELTAMLRG